MGRILACACLVGAVVAAGAAAATRPQAPPAAGATVRGGKASLATLRGKPVFVNVWSSW